MNKFLAKMLRVKTNGKYVKSAKEVANYHGVHLNAVYQSRKQKKNPDKLDKLMLFDEASKGAGCEDCIGLTMRGSKVGLLTSLSRVMDDDKRYLLVFTEEDY